MTPGSGAERRRVGRAQSVLAGGVFPGRSRLLNALSWSSPQTPDNERNRQSPVICCPPAVVTAEEIEAALDIYDQASSTVRL